jgi:hypothetical protein
MKTINKTSETEPIPYSIMRMVARIEDILKRRKVSKAEKEVIIATLLDIFKEGETKHLQILRELRREQFNILETIHSARFGISQEIQSSKKRIIHNIWLIITILSFCIIGSIIGYNIAT